MPNQHCFASLDLCLLRVARLNAVGSPISGASNGYRTDSPIKLEVGLDLATGDDLEQKNGVGAVCAAFKDCDRIKRLSLKMDLCQLDAQLLELLCGFSLFTSGGNTIGAQFPAVGGSCSNGVCLEVWTKAWDVGSPAIPTYTSPNAAYIHWVFPKATFAMGNFTLEHGFLVVPVEGKGEENTRVTSNGPFDDWPAPVSGPGGITRVGGWFFDATLPATSCGYVNVVSAGS